MRRFNGEDSSVGKIGVIWTLGDSRAHKELKKETMPVREEWEFKVFEKPAGLLIDHYGDKTQLSKAELEDLIYGRVDFSKYPQIPRYMYRTVVVKATEALGIVYRPYMLEGATPERVVKPRFEIPLPKPWDVALKRSEELKERLKRYSNEIDNLEAFLKAVKEMKKK